VAYNPETPQDAEEALTDVVMYLMRLASVLDVDHESRSRTHAVPLWAIFTEARCYARIMTDPDCQQEGT